MPYPRWLKVFACIAIVNVLTFMAVAVYLGGDALNGYVSEGRYFLAAKGRAYEVSPALFLYSRWHAISAIAMTIITIAACAMFWRRAQMNRRTGPYV